jgi:hypothetical protein
LHSPENLAEGEPSIPAEKEAREAVAVAASV